MEEEKAEDGEEDEEGEEDDNGEDAAHCEAMAVAAACDEGGSCVTVPTPIVRPSLRRMNRPSGAKSANVSQQISFIVRMWHLIESPCFTHGGFLSNGFFVFLSNRHNSLAMTASS